ncbi:MAG: cell division protein FtsQ/DivIB [Anaerolineales bacterium]
MALVGRSLGRPRTRADQVRRRRARIADEREPAPRPRRASAAGPWPASTARPPGGATARPRRRRTLALPVEVGAELSLPALPALRMGPRALTAVLLGIWALTIHAAWTGARFEVTDIGIEGAKLLTEAQIRSIARLHGLPSFAVDPQAVEQRLESYAEIDGAEVRVRWPNQVAIEVQERRPIVEWQDGTQVWWLNASGVAFIQREPYPGLVRVVAEQPVLEIDEDALLPAILPEVLWEAVAVAEQLPHIGDLTYSPTHGIGFEDPRGWKVIVGQGGDLKAKLEVYAALTGQLMERGVKVQLVNIEDPSAPYYKVMR